MVESLLLEGSINLNDGRDDSLRVGLSEKLRAVGRSEEGDEGNDAQRGSCDCCGWTCYIRMDLQGGPETHKA